MENALQIKLKTISDCFLQLKDADLIEAEAITLLEGYKFVPFDLDTPLNGMAGYRLIHFGTYNLALDFIRKLLPKLKKLDVVDDLGETCLHLLLSSDHYSNNKTKYDNKEKQYDYKAGAKIEINKEKRLAAISREKGKRLEILKLILEKYPDNINKQNKKHETLLDISIRKCLIAEAKFLLEKGAIVSAKNIQDAEKHKKIDLDLIKLLNKKFQAQNNLKTITKKETSEEEKSPRKNPATEVSIKEKQLLKHNQVLARSYGNVTQQLVRPTPTQSIISEPVINRGRSRTIVHPTPTPVINNSPNKKEEVLPKRTRSKSADPAAKERLNIVANLDSDQSKLYQAEAVFAKLEKTNLEYEQKEEKIAKIPPKIPPRKTPSIVKQKETKPPSATTDTKTKGNIFRK